MMLNDFCKIHIWKRKKKRTNIYGKRQRNKKGNEKTIETNLMSTKFALNEKPSHRKNNFKFKFP